MKINKKREYTHEDMEKLGGVINELKLIACQLDQDIASGRITHEQWEAAAHELLERKKEIEAILRKRPNLGYGQIWSRLNIFLILRCFNQISAIWK